MPDLQPYRPTDEEYDWITSFLPIICVDMLPVRRVGEEWHVGLIVRATGSQAGKLTILGGRILYGETAEEAMNRHLKTDLQVQSFTYYRGLNEETPFTVQQYFRTTDSDSDKYGFDPTKHALALTYLVNIDETEIRPVKEADGFEWVSNETVAQKEIGFNQKVVVERALTFLSK